MLHNAIKNHTKYIHQTKAEVEEIEFDPNTVVFSALRRITVRMEAHAKQIQIKFIHANSQSSPTLQQHEPPDKVKF